MSTTSVSVAFYDSGDDDKPFFSLSPQFHSSRLEGNKLLVFYDNFKHPTGRYYQKPIIFPSSDHFIPLDTIDCNFPVYNLLQRKSAAKYTLSNFFYANIRLRMIKDEYKAVRARARQLLVDIPDPFAKIKFTATGPTKYTQYATSSKNKGYSGSQKESVYQGLRRLERKSNAFAKDNWSIKSGAPKAKNKDKDSDSPEDGEFLSFFRIAQSKPKLQSANVQDGRGYLSHTSKGLGPAQLGENSQKEYVAKFSTGKTSSVPHMNEEDLPLVFRVPTNFVQYLMSNKIEAVIFGVMLLLLVAITSSLRSRRNEQAGQG